MRSSYVSLVEVSINPFWQSQDSINQNFDYLSTVIEISIIWLLK